MSSPPPRRGHAAVSAIISDMAPYLPPSTVDRPGYKHCRTTYGLLTTTYKRAEYSATPSKVYKELQQLESELRRRLQNLDAVKGVPAQMMRLLDELKDALEQALSAGVDTEFLIEGVRELLEEKLEVQPVPKPERGGMVPDAKYQSVRAELVEAKKRIQVLNQENNDLVLRVRRLEAERRGGGVGG